MRSILFACLLGSSVFLDAELFFWNNKPENMLCLRFESCDICVDGGGYTCCNQSDIRRIKKYIQDELLPSQNNITKQFLYRLLSILSQYGVHVPYSNEQFEVKKRIAPIDPDAKTESKPSKPLTTDQKKELLLKILTDQGLTRPINRD